jgi:hypothetical protein
MALIKAFWRQKDSTFIDYNLGPASPVLIIFTQRVKSDSLAHRLLSSFLAQSHAMHRLRG